MIHHVRRHLSFYLLGLSLAALLVSFALPLKSYADYNASPGYPNGSKLNTPCGLSTNKGSLVITIAWSAPCMQLEFVNRAQIKVTIKDADVNALQGSTTNTVKLGVLTGDLNFAGGLRNIYTKVPAGSNPSDFGNVFEEPFSTTLMINGQLRDVMTSGDPSQRFGKLSSTAILSSITNSQLYVVGHGGRDPQLFGTNVCSGYDHDDFVGLSVSPNGDRVLWNCQDHSGVGNNGAASPIASLQNNISKSSLNNANVTHVANGTASKLTTVFSGSDADHDSFTYCPQTNAYALGTDCNSPADGYVINKPDSYFKGNNLVEASVTSNTGKPSFTTLVAQSGSDVAGRTVLGNSSDSSGTAPDDTLDCGGGSWNWLICPAIQLSMKAADKVDAFIMSTLDIDVKPIFDNTSDKSTPASGYYAAWNSFRVIATAMLIIGGLVMVASQAFGFEFLDAYTVRKVLPRLLVAVIGISLSWPLMRLVVSFFDTLGFDIRALMYTPFSHMGGNINLTTSILSTGGVLAALFIMGPAALTLILTALLAVFVGFVILVVREVAIIMLIILSPIAIAAYILPNTQKLWKLWSENFLGLMLMFPIISALIAAGHIFSAITVRGGTGDTGGVVATAIGILAYFIPYFLLPLAARLATGVIGNLAGVVNDRGKGAFDRMKKFRGAKAAENLNKMKSGQRFSERNSFTRGFNRASFSAGAGYKGGFGIGKRGSEAFNVARTNAAATDIMKSAGWNAVQHNDDALRALTYKSAAAARADGVSEAGIRAAQTSVGFGGAQAIAAAQQMSTTGTAYRDIDDVRRTIARAAGGNESTVASLAGFINSDTKRSGRHDLAPGFAALNDLSRQAGGMSNSGTTLGQAAESAWSSGSLYQHANDKGKNIENAIAHHTGLLGSTDAKEREKAAVFFNELKSMQPNATGDVKARVEEALDTNRTRLKEVVDPTHADYVGDSSLGVADRYYDATGKPMRPPAPGTSPPPGTVIRQETADQRIERRSRTYERPDPNHL